jgi:hypothetical protein
MGDDILEDLDFEDLMKVIEVQTRPDKDHVAQIVLDYMKLHCGADISKPDYDGVGRKAMTALEQAGLKYKKNYPINEKEESDLKSAQRALEDLMYKNIYDDDDGDYFD